MLKIIISSCSLILIMYSSQKMRSLHILAKIFKKMSLSDYYKLNSYKEKSVYPRCFVNDGTLNSNVLNTRATRV